MGDMSDVGDRWEDRHHPNCPSVIGAGICTCTMPSEPLDLDVVKARVEQAQELGSDARRALIMIDVWSIVDALRGARAEVERLHDALDWLVHLHYGMSKGGDNCPITDEEWNDAIKQGRMALDEYDRQRAKPGELKK